MRALIRTTAAALVAVAALGASAQEASSYELGIVVPAAASTVFSDTGDVTVQASVVPELAPGDKVELLVDGAPAGPASASLDFALTGIPRGQHVLQARIIDASGNVGSVSPPDTFYVWAASLLFPNRKAMTTHAATPHTAVRTAG
jgi:hypothetical protein